MHANKRVEAILNFMKTKFMRMTDGTQNTLAPSMRPNPQYKRFLTENPVAYKSAIQAAETYASKLADNDHEWLYSKPFDPTPGNPQFLSLIHI